MTYNAADRKHIRAAEKSLLQTDTINREVISGIMQVQNGRHWMYDQLAESMVFADPFNPDPYINAYNAGLRRRGVLLFNEIILYSPQQFIRMIEEAHERAVTADTIRRTAERDTSPDDEWEPSPIGSGADAEPA